MVGQVPLPQLLWLKWFPCFLICSQIYIDHMMHVLVSILGAKCDHIPFKCRCPIKTSNWHLARLANCRGLSISSLPMPEYSFHAGFKWFLVNANMTRGKNWGGYNYFVFDRELCLVIVEIWLRGFLFLFHFLRQRDDMPMPKQKRQWTTWQYFLSSREEISHHIIELPTSSLRFGYLSTIIQ